MSKKRFSAEQIVTLLRQIEVSMAQGKLRRLPCTPTHSEPWSRFRVWRLGPLPPSS